MVRPLVLSAAHEMVEFIIDYVENIREREVLPRVKPGYLAPMVPDKAPYLRENWAKIMPDIERVIMPGVSVCKKCARMRACVRARLLVHSITGERKPRLN